jgi:hypothetical protein
MLYSGNLEPPIEELLNDPIAALLMASDRITPDIVWSQVETARQKLRRREARGRRSARHKSAKGFSSRRNKYVIEVSQ